MNEYLLAILAGVSAGLIGIGYRIGSKGKVFPIQTALLLDIVGVIVFSSMAKWQYNDVPAAVWLCGIMAGWSQYLAVRLLREALQRGPLSPAWCAVGLGFAPVLIYCWLFHGEELSNWHIASVIFTVGAIVVASVGNSKSADSAHKIANAREAGIYGLLLVLLLGFCSVMCIILKIANYMECEGGSMIDKYGNHIMAVTYLFMLLPTLFDLSLSNTWQINRYFWFGGLFAAVGGVCSYGIQLLIISAPSVVVFALPGVTSLLFASLISVFVFHEKRTKFWYATVALAILAILCNRGN